MNQSQLKANTYHRRQARENAFEQVTIGFRFVSQSGASFDSQSQSVVKQIQSKRELLLTPHYKAIKRFMG